MMPRMSKIFTLLLISTAFMGLLSGCSAGTIGADGTGLINSNMSFAEAPKFSLPPANARFDYQLGGAYKPPAGVTIVGRDRLEKPAGLGYDICYINGFQTQPADSEKFWQEHPDLVVQVNGAPVVDPNWKDEYLYDTSTSTKQMALAAMVKPWIEGCKTAGYAAVEIDNLDSFLRSQGKLNAQNNIDLATEYAQLAHNAGLAIAQKNAVEQRAKVRAAGYDFAVTESCARWNECGKYLDTYSVVLDIEYTDELGEDAFPAACQSKSRPTAMILRDHYLVTPKDSDYFYQSC